MSLSPTSPGPGSWSVSLLLYQIIKIRASYLPHLPPSPTPSSPSPLIHQSPKSKLILFLNLPQNKSLSDNIDPILTLQGISWFKRKAISFATVTLHVKQYTPPSSSSTEPTHIDISQTVTGGMEGTKEERVLDWSERGHTDHLFGKLKGQSRWVSTSGITTSAGDGTKTDPPSVTAQAYVAREEENSYLSEGWEEGEAETGGPGGERHIESFVANEEVRWTARQIWGFAVVDGKRYYVRRVVVRRIGGEECLMWRGVYNWQGREDAKKEDDDGLVY